MCLGVQPVHNMDPGSDPPPTPPPPAATACSPVTGELLTEIYLPDALRPSPLPAQLSRKHLTHLPACLPSWSEDPSFLRDIISHGIQKEH